MPLQPPHEALPPEWKEVLEALPDAIVVADDEGRYVFANTAAGHLLNRSPSELVGLRIEDVASDAATVSTSWEDFVRTGSQQGDFPLLLPDRSSRTVQFNAKTSFRPGLHVSVLRDVSDHRRVVDRLRLTESLFVQAFTMTPAATNIRSLQTGAFIEVNQAFSEVTGYWRSEVIGRTARSLGLWEDMVAIENVLATLLSGQSRVNTRAVLKTKSGERREFSVALRRFEVAGEPHAVSTYTDLALL